MVYACGKNGVYFNSKELHPKGSKFFPVRVAPNEEVNRFCIIMSELFPLGIYAH